MTPTSRPLDDRTADAVLTGRATEVAGVSPDELADLAAFAADLRSAAATAPHPSPVLAEVLARGLTSQGSEAPVIAARGAHEPVARVAGPSVRTRRMIGLALAKLAAVGVAAKVVVAGTAVAVTAAGAGAAGVLPEGLQGQFEDLRDRDAQVIVDEATEAELPEGSGSGAAVTEERAVEPDTGTATDVRDSFRSQVPEDVTDEDAPGVDGPDLADDAAGEDGQEGRDRAADARGDLEIPGVADEQRERGGEAAEERSAPRDVPPNDAAADTERREGPQGHGSSTPASVRPDADEGAPGEGSRD